MAVFKRGKWYRYEFVFNGKRIQESAKTTSKSVAKEAERLRRRELEQAALGIPTEQRANRIRSVNDVVKEYLDHYSADHRPKSVAFANGRLANVTRLLGTVLLTDLTEKEIKKYMKQRQTEDVSGRTINAELGELSRAIGKEWKVLWPKVRKLDERTDVGRALSPEEEQRLLGALTQCRSEIMPSYLKLALLTAMRSGEILSLRWEQVDFLNRMITVGRAKTSSGTGRQIPINNELYAILTAHAHWFTERFGSIKPELYLFPFGKPIPCDPTRATTTIKTSWNRLRKDAGVQCRLHDLRHTAITKMAENGVPEATMLAIVGHMSRKMLERYSHIRVNAKRDAMAGLSLSAPATIPCTEVIPAKVPAMTELVAVN